jgi:hypothetical protein
MSEGDPAEPESAERLRESFVTLMRELLDGPPADVAFVVNPGDRGLLASLEGLSAEAASARPGGRSSVAAHVDHLRYGFELLNRWARGENPWADSNYAASWQRQHVDQEHWSRLRAALDNEARTWMTSGAPRVLDEGSVTEALSSLVHLAYHLGAIRQLVQGASGPPAKD